MNCKVKNCQFTKKRFHPKFSLCDAHYQRLYRHNDAYAKSQKDYRNSIEEDNIVKIPIGLDCKQYAIVDKEYRYLDKYKWYLDNGYARGFINKRKVYLHQIILSTNSKAEVVDHINRNKLDNRLDNIRLTTQSQNMFNSSIRKDNKSGHKGISWDKSKSKWKVSIGNNFVGRFQSFDKAIIVRRNIEKEVAVYV